MKRRRPRRIPRRTLFLGSRLDRYVATHFVSSYGTALLLMTGLFLVMDMAGNLDDYLETWEDGTSAPTSTVLRYYALNLPYLFLQVAPFVTLLAGMFTVNRLLRSREVSATLAAGISAHRLIAPILLGGLVLAAGMFALRELVGRGLSEMRDSAHYVLEEQSFEEVYEDLVVVDLSGSPVIVDRFWPTPADGGPPRIEGLTAILRSGGRGAASVYVRIEADRATWVDGRWNLHRGLRTIISGDQRREQDRQVDEVTTLEGYEFTPELIRTYRRARAAPLELSFSEVQELMRRDPDDLSYQTLWHYHLTFPLANLILLLVGVPLLFSYERGRGSERLAIGGLLCIFYYAVDFVFRTMGISGGFSPVLAAWIPVLGFGSLGVVLLDSMRT